MFGRSQSGLYSKQKTALMDMEQLALPEENSLLIVDDDRPFRERLARAMETRGFAVKSAATVRKGVAMVNAAPPAFAVVDLKLDDGNGLDVIEVITESTARLVVNRASFHLKRIEVGDLIAKLTEALNP